MFTNDQLLDKFGIPNPGTGEIEIDRIALKKHYIERGVRILVEIETLKDDMKELISEVDERNYDKAEMKALIKYCHKNSIEAEIEKLEEVQSKIKNLFDPEEESED